MKTNKKQNEIEQGAILRASQYYKMMLARWVLNSCRETLMDVLDAKIKLKNIILNKGARYVN